MGGSGIAEMEEILGGGAVTGKKMSWEKKSLINSTNIYWHIYP